LFGGEAYMEIAKRAAEAGELQAAWVVYRQVQADEPTNVKAIALGASMLYRLGETEKAASEYERALTLDPDNSLALNGLGALAAQGGDYNAAIRHFVKGAKAEAERDSPDHVLLGEVYRNWALALARKGDLAEAAEKLRQALKANPEDSVAHRELGDIAAQLGNLAESRKELEQAVALNPKDSAAWLSLAVMAANAGKTEEALEALRGVDTANLAHRFRGAMVLEYLGRLQEAESAYADLIGRLTKKEDPELRAVAHLRLGNLRIRRGEVAAGAADFQMALQIDPKLADAANNLAWLKATCPDPAMRNGQEAVRLAERACSLLAEEQPGYLDTLAAAYARQEEWDRAVATADRAESLARKLGAERLADEIARRRQRYQRREAYEQPLEKNAP
jgi:tetratricopeptide (TPR) repeat protein